MPEAHFTTVRMVGCAIPRLEAARLRTEGDLHLPRCRVEHGIRLTDAQIGTDLLINQIDRAAATAAAARSPPTACPSRQDLQAELIESYGEFSLRGAKVGVSLSLRGSRLRAARASGGRSTPRS